MPTYDYKCPHCGNQIEIWHSILKELKPKCSKCGGLMVKQMSATSLLKFKGEGFHANDYPTGGC